MALTLQQFDELSKLAINLERMDRELEQRIYSTGTYGNIQRTNSNFWTWYTATESVDPDPVIDTEE